MTHCEATCDAWGLDLMHRAPDVLMQALTCLSTECKVHRVLASPIWYNVDWHLVWLSEHLTKLNHLHKLPLKWGIYNHLWGATNLFSRKSIWEWKVISITLMCITWSRRDIPECHFHLNLLESDYWRCRAAEQGENGLHYKVLGKGPAINQKAGSM